MAYRGHVRTISYSKKKRFGKAFRTRAGKYGRYVYVHGRRVAFETLRSAKRGAYRYVADRTYRSMRKKWG
jgi:hypothetical protein